MLCICQNKICNIIEVCTCTVASPRSTLNDLVQSLNFYKCAVLKLSRKELNPGRDTHVLLAVIGTQTVFVKQRLF